MSAALSNPAMAMELLQEGWIRANLDANKRQNVCSFLSFLHAVKEPKDAAALLKQALAGQTIDGVQDLLMGQRGGLNVVHYWANELLRKSTGQAEKDNGVDHALLLAAKDIGVDFSQIFDYPTGGTYRNTLLSAFVWEVGNRSNQLDSPEDLSPDKMQQRSKNPCDALGRVKSMFDLGMRVDKTCATILTKGVRDEHFEPWMRFLTEHCAVRADDMLALTKKLKMDPNRRAWIQACAAREAVDSVFEPRRSILVTPVNVPKQEKKGLPCPL